MMRGMRTGKMVARIAAVVVIMIERYEVNLKMNGLGVCKELS